ncbi:MAG: tetratricopeptide repeat protein [Thermoanaerobaculia bacterium]|nr:tetratricopeptide repeat protein [Thermoanaerobaculia bacterium]
MRPLRTEILLALTLLFVACGEKDSRSSDSPELATASESVAEVDPSKLLAGQDLTAMEPQVAARLRQVRAAVSKEPKSAAAWGDFGKVAHAHELWELARLAYRQAEKLDGEEVRWPYFAGDVLSVLGTDPEATLAAFRRAVALRPDYPPAHLRLGNALLTAGLVAEAQTEFELALELAPDLQPASVALAQLLLAADQAEAAVPLLEGVLATSPRHGQALAALGQAYMRLGRRDEARRIAERARSAAAFNLYSDPLMSEVVTEGVSSVLIWDRAKAFLDNGNSEQAALGLQQVVKLQPDNPDARRQLALAYRNLGKADLALLQLQEVVELAPEEIESRLQLASLLIGQQKPHLALPHLRRILERAPEDPEAAWMLGRALVLGGEIDAGLARFEATEASTGDVPDWVRNDWGSALAQQGRLEEAAVQFDTVLATDPENAQAHFYRGLLLEGQGDREAAVSAYCRSMRSEPSPPAAARLQALGRRCG